jgi:putative ATP-dependent endonuclease of the OLD family
VLGRLLRAVNWEIEREGIKVLTDQISGHLSSNPAVNTLSKTLKTTWNKLHKGNFFADPKITFVASEIEALLRHMSVSFSPGHDENFVDFSRLSDGQKSLLYLSLVLSSQAIGRGALSSEEQVSFDLDKLRPPVLTLVAIEEPENSLSPHYLGRIVAALNDMSINNDAQAVIATHAPSMLRRVAPERIRYLRLAEERTTRIKHIQLPIKTDEAHKFVREAVQAFPEIYFSQLVVLGEGDSEEIVLPRLLKATGIAVDESAVVVAPLGGRHVNHFWRLLSSLDIPYLTLLDLDVARYQGGWGRIKNVNDQLARFEPDKILPPDWGIPSWDAIDTPVRTHHFFGKPTRDIFSELETRGVFFSFPLDLDFAMLLSYSEAYGSIAEKCDAATVKAVLGKNNHNSNQYSLTERKLFGTYHRQFKLGSKPAAHINALAKLSDVQLLKKMPRSLKRLSMEIMTKLAELRE